MCQIRSRAANAAEDDYHYRLTLPAAAASEAAATEMLSGSMEIPSTDWP